MELKEIHSAENQLTKNLPRLAKTVQTDKLRDLLELRLEQGQRLIEEIDDIFDELEASPGRRKNVAAEGLINDAREHMMEIEPGPALDAVLIGAIQKTEHYCIAAWGTAKALGEALSQEQVVGCMDRALNEGKELDRELTTLAEEEVTPELMSSDEEDEGEEENESRSNEARSARSSSEKRGSARHH